MITLILRTGRFDQRGAAFAAALTVALTALAPRTAAAQDTSGAQTALQEVVVTSRRISEKLIDVPATVTVLTKDEIQATGVQIATEFLQLVPAVTIVTGNVEAGDVQISIRGINGTRDAESNVALVVDGVLKTNTAALNENQGVLSQIEVLKGPQGALYGRNASAGAIVLTTQKPGDEFESSITAGYGSQEHKKARGFVSVPIVPGTALLVSGDWEKSDGFFRNTFFDTPAFTAYSQAIASVNPGVSASQVPGGPRDSVDEFTRWNANVRLLSKLDDATELDFKARYGKFDGGAVEFGAVYSLPGLVPFIGAAANGNVNNYNFTNAFQGNIDPQQNQLSQEASLKVTHDFDKLSLKGWVSYSDIGNSYWGDGTSGGDGYFFTQPACKASTAALAGFPVPAPTFIGGTPGTSFFGPYTPTTCDGYQYNRRDQQDASAELRIASIDGGPLSWQGGVYALNINRHICVNLGTDNGLGVIPECFTLNPRSRTEALSDDRYHTNAYAAFGSTDFAFSPALKGGLALRYDIERRSVENLIPTNVRTLYVNPEGNGLGGYYLNPGLDPAFNPSGALPPRSATFSQLEPKVTLSYEPDSRMTLFTDWGIGFKSGGFNSGGSSAIVDTFDKPPVNAGVTIYDSYKKETSSSTEAGVKANLADGHVYVESAAYYTRVTNMQFFEFFVGSFGLLRTVSNIDLVNLYGWENSVNWNVTNVWSVFASGNLLHSRIEKNSSRPDTVGNKAPYAAEYTANLGSQLTFPVDGSIKVVARADYRLTGPTWFHTVQAQTVSTPNGPANYSQTERNKFGLLNLRLGIDAGHWSVAAFGSNVTNKQWLEEIVPAPELGGSFVSPGNPREYGVEATARF